MDLPPTARSSNPLQPGLLPITYESVPNRDCCAPTSADVWLIDDDELANFLTGQVMRRHRFAEQVCAFTRVADALAHLDLVLRTEPARLPRLILLDIHMPFLNGWDFLDAYAQLPASVRQRVPVYVLSGSIEPADQLKAAHYQDVRGFMAKPLSGEDLQALQDQTSAR